MDNEKKNMESTEDQMPGQQEPSGGGQKGDEMERQRQMGDERGDTRSQDKDYPSAQQLAERDLQPGGTGKLGDQQQMGQDREQRKDKSENDAGSDKMHGP